MKNLLKIFGKHALLLTVITMIAFAGVQHFELTDLIDSRTSVVLGSTALVIGFSFAKSPIGALRDGLDASEFTTALTRYIKANMSEVWNAVYKKMYFKPYLRGVSGVTGFYTETSGQVNDVLQAFQQGWTPKGTITLVPYKGSAFHVKVDIEIGNIDTLFNGWLDFLTNEGVVRDQWPFVRWAVFNHVIPKLAEDLDLALVRGRRVEPTIGTPGTVLQSMNGMLSIVEDEITAGNLTPILTGAIDNTNAVQQMETFVKSIPQAYLDRLESSSMKAPIFASMHNARAYKENYRERFGALDAASRNKTELDQYNFEVIGIPGFGTSDRLVTTLPNNFLHLYNKRAMPDSMESQVDKRQVLLLADFFAGFSWSSTQYVFVNDQM